MPRFITVPIKEWPPTTINIEHIIGFQWLPHDTNPKTRIMLNSGFNIYTTDTPEKINTKILESKEYY